MREIDLSFWRGLEQYTLNIRFDVWGDPSVGIFPHAELAEVRFFNRNAHCWQPFALSDTEFGELADRVNEEW